MFTNYIRTLNNQNKHNYNCTYIIFAIYKIIKKNLFFSFENILNKVSQNIKQKHNLLLRPYNLFLHINIITNFKTKFIKNIFKLLN